MTFPSIGKRKFVFGALAAAMLLGGCESKFAYIPQTSGQAYYLSQAKEMNRRYEDIPVCTQFYEDYNALGWPMGDTLKSVAEIDRRVRKRFVYRREETDNWNAYVDIMLHTIHDFAGDCDDLSATVVAMTRCAGVPEDRLGFMLVKAYGSDTVNHMIGFYTDQNGRSYAIGDTFGGMRPVLHYDQEPYAWAFLNDLSSWHMVDEDTDFQDPRHAVIEANRRLAQ